VSQAQPGAGAGLPADVQPPTAVRRPVTVEAGPPRPGATASGGEPIRAGGQTPEVLASSKPGGGGGSRPTQSTPRRGKVTPVEETPPAQQPSETTPVAEPATPGQGGARAKGQGAARRGSSRGDQTQAKGSRGAAEPKQGGRGTRTGERKPTRAERREQARRDAESDAIQRDAQGAERPPQRNPNLDEVRSGRGGPERNPGTIESGDVGGAQVRRGRGGRQVVSEDRAVAEAAGSAFERPMVRDFAGRQPSTAETFGSSLGNWARLRARFPRIAELFSGGSRPDGVSVDPANRTIRLLDSTSRPNSTHWEGSVEYMQRLADDPAMRRLYNGWKIVIEERYWESGFKKLVPSRSVRIGDSSNSGGSTSP